MRLPNVLVAILLGAAVWHTASTILIYDHLKKRGEEVSFLWLRLKSIPYASRYRALTSADTGRTGPLFYHWLGSIWTAVAAVAALIVVAWL